MLAKLRRQDWPLLVVDAGDMLYPRARSPYDSKAQLDARARFVISTQGAAGLDAWCPSVLDLRLGSDSLRELAQEAGIGLVATNLLDDTGRPLFAPALTFRRGGLRVGVIGLVGRRGDAPDGLRVTDPAEAARRALTDLSGKVDLVIALSNLGLQADQRLAQEVDGILAILGAGDDRMILVPRRVEQTLILQPYKQGEYLGLLRLSLTGPVQPLLDELDRLRLERQRAKLAADSPKAVELDRELAAFSGRSTFRAVLRPLSADDPTDPATARAIEAQLDAEAELP